MNERVSLANSLAVAVANVSRRNFLQSAILAGGLVLAVGYINFARSAEDTKYGADGMPHGWTDNPLAFVVTWCDHAHPRPS